MKQTAVFTLASLLALTACAPAPNSDKPGQAKKEPSIEVLGRAFVELAPNRASFNVEFEEKAESSAEASAKVVERANRATEAMRLAADDKLRITSDLNVRPYYQQVTRRLNEYNEQLVENVHPDALLGYVARVSISVIVLDPEQAATARGAALAAGPVQSSPMGFYLEPTAESQRAVFEAAVADAQARAELVASGARARLGDLILLQEGNGPCLGSPSTSMGYATHAEMARSAVRPQAAPPPAPGASPQELADAAGQFALAADLQPQRVDGRVCAIYALK